MATLSTNASLEDKQAVTQARRGKRFEASWRQFCSLLEI